MLDHKDVKNVAAFASGENLIIGQINNQLIACTNVTLAVDYKIPQNYVKEFAKILVSKSDLGVLVTFFYKSADGLHITTMKTEFEDVYGKSLWSNLSNLC